MIKVQDWCGIQALNADYWLRVDRQSDAPVDLLYTQDGHMQIGALDCRGREAVQAFFLDRNEKEELAVRTTRHSPAMLHIEEQEPSRWRVRSTVYVMAGNGAWPMASAAPATVGDFDDVVVRTLGGQYLFESRRATIVFTGAGAAAFAR